jgi:hypothetical protein
MPTVNLLGQPYAGKSLIASAQRSINLYAEANDKFAAAPITYYQFPGNELYSSPLDAGRGRCIYRTSIGTVYKVVGPTVYLLQSNGAMVFVGSVPDRASQIYMADNGLAVVLVDGSSEGWAIDMSTNTFGQIIDPSFYGADQVRFLDTFFVFNRPDTNQFYISLSMVTFALLTAGTSFDPLDIAAKSGNADPIVAILVIQKNLWLIGELTTEPWIGTGAADFYFQQIQGTFINHGCIAPYSAAAIDVLGFWLMQDLQGKNIIMRTKGYDVEEVSTPYLVSQFNTYETTNDAIGMMLQTEDHAFYILTFPTANITWAMELTTGYWFQLAKWNLETGEFDRYRASGCAFAFGFNLIDDYSTGKVYKLNPQIATDGGDNMRFVRRFIHMVGPEFQRVIYKNASANIEPGTSTKEVGSLDNDNEPEIFLSWSDDRGKTFNTPLAQSLGRQSEFLTDPQWNRLGMARDRVFELAWNGPVITALNGAFVEAQPLRT